MHEEDQDQLKGAKNMELLPKITDFLRPLSLAWNVAATIQDKLNLAWNVAATNQDKMILAWNVAACLRFSFLQEISSYCQCFSGTCWDLKILNSIKEPLTAAVEVRSWTYHFPHICNERHLLVSFCKLSLSRFVAATFQAKLSLSWIVAATFRDKFNLSWNVAATFQDKLKILWKKQVFCRFHLLFRPIFCFETVFMYLTRIFWKDIGPGLLFLASETTDTKFRCSTGVTTANSTNKNQNANKLSWVIN